MYAATRSMVPRLPGRVIHRTRLISQLHAAIGSGVSVLESPAGSGKTTLLAQFVGELDFTVRWLTLDASSGSPEVFSHQLGIALSGSPDFSAPATASKTSDLRAYLNAELCKVVQASATPLLLVVDNIHEVADSFESAALLSWLIESMPEGAEVLLAGRDRPTLPALNARIATGDVLVLDGAQMAFTLEEIVAVTAGGSDADPNEVLAATDGWAVGVMAATSGRQLAENVSALAFDQYLREEIWNQVPSELQEPLRRFSLQPTISRSCVEADFGAAVWRSLASWVAGRDFLCEHLTAREFRLNPLLRQFIASDFDQRDPGGYREALHAVVSDLVDSGNFADAVEFTRSRGDEFQLADLLEEHSPRLIVQGSLTLLMRSFECISEPTLRRRPVLRGMYARVIAHIGDPEDAVRRVDSLLRDARAPVAARTHALLARVRALRLLARPDEARETVANLTALLEEVETSLQAEVLYNIAEFELSVTRDFLKAEKLLGTVIDSIDTAAVEPLGLLARSTLGQSLAMRGDAPGAVTVLTRAAMGWRNVGRSSNLGWVLNNLGMAHIQAGDFASAVTVLREAVSEGINCGNHRNVAYATASLGDAEIALGHFEAARINYEEAIRICATEAPDESLAALSIAGLSSALLGKGDLQQADFFARRALLVSVSSANSYEIAICKLQQAAVEFASGNYVACIAEASDAVARFKQMEVLPMLATAEYRVAMANFKANKRVEAEESLGRAAEALTERWMAATLVPLVRENPMFAQWAATRRSAGATVRALLEKHSFDTPTPEAAAPVEVGQRFPVVSVRSLGRTSVMVAGTEVADNEWASVRAKEMFFLLLANRDGLRKEQAVEHLYPDLPREKCNSAFHSNLYRVRHALYQDSVVKSSDGLYQLNTEGTFEWDVEEFEQGVEAARKCPAGSLERATALQQALEMYSGPFATLFHSEWAASLRDRLAEHAHESLATLAGYFAGREDFESAAMCMERVLKANRFNEEAAFQFALYRSRGGQVVQALDFIDEYSHTYVNELGEPLPERFWELRSAIAAGVAV